MLIKRPRGWEIAEPLATPESVYWNRRRFMTGVAATGLAWLTACDGNTADSPKEAGGSGSSAAAGKPQGAELYPFERNSEYTVSRSVTDEAITSTYNNFYEFGSHKKIFKQAQKLQTSPWDVRIDGLVEKPFTISVDDLMRKMPLEERVYRLRCVEAWSIVVPWSGFPMRALVDMAKPLSSAKYVRMETFMKPDVARGQRSGWYPWPYTEGLTIAEASNELAFLVTGVYGKPARPQFGAPLRLAVPWKYGFKSIKSIVRFEFTDKRPKTFWEEVQGNEYGFWANVNPKVPHPRWSQATEKVIGTDERVPTELFNGYGEFVADIYRGMDGERLWR
ncbi:MAG: protein-methionine-sulfoxide reductase catalytic subunit MsrP [Alphaproteobacteria bacterium]